jgi:hypothetical protein
MKTKLIFSTVSKEIEIWKNLSFIPQILDWFNVKEILNSKELEIIKQSAKRWSGIWGIVEFVEDKFNDNESYAEVFIWCED